MKACCNNDCPDCVNRPVGEIPDMLSLEETLKIPDYENVLMLTYDEAMMHKDLREVFAMIARGECNTSKYEAEK